MTVHDVEVEVVCSGLFGALDLFTQTGKIRGKYRWCQYRHATNLCYFAAGINRKTTTCTAVVKTG